MVMKDIRPILAQVSELLSTDLSNVELANRLMRIREESELLESEFWITMEDLGGVDEEKNIWSRSGGFIMSDWEFNNELKGLKYMIESHSKMDWPESHNKLTLNYSSKYSGFGLAITLQVSGLTVQCIHDDLKQQVKQALAKLNQNQSAENFLLNAVYVLPKRYKDYKLVL